MMEKIELKHLAPYLPYGLKGQIEHPYIPYQGDWLLLGISDNGLRIQKDDYFLKESIDGFKPLLIPLSEFNNSAADEEIFNVQKAYTSVKLNECCDFPYWQFEILVKHHFDVFNLIPANLALKKI